VASRRRGLERGKRDASLIWLKEQESAGIDIVSNGEQFSEHFVHGFLKHIDGIDWNKITTMGIRDNRYDADVPTVTSALARKSSVHGDEVKFCLEHTRNEFKFTLPGPMTICDTIANEHYGSRPEMAMAFADLLNQEAKELAALGVGLIQFDEPAFNVFMPDVKDWVIEALHRACEGLPCKTVVHICYGYGLEQNLQWKKTLGNEWRQYEEIFSALNASKIDQVSLECANSHVPMSLIGLLSDKQVMVAAIDVTNDKIESAEQVAAVIKEACQFVAPEQVMPRTNCGLAPMPKSVATGKLWSLAAGAELARTRL
jgi:5-methyltetrahydropteroyltriglutamate--homocysteine methyltransferase